VQAQPILSSLRALTMSSREMLEPSHMLRKSPSLSYRFRGESNSCRQKPLMNKTHLDHTLFHHQDPIPRDDGSQSMRDTQQRLALELAVDGLLDL
jgi:hypothetical protein